MTTAARLSEVPFDAGRQMPFACATGRGLKIAVVDSGVNLRHPHIIARTLGVDLHLGEQGDGSTGNETAEDKLGHGTAVTAAVQEKAPGARYYAVKLFSDSLCTTTPRLIEAIEWTIDQGMDLVNLSLGTRNLEYREEMQAIVNRARDAGVVLIGARSDGADPVLPGILDGVIGVDLDWSLPRDRYRIEDEDGTVRFLAPGFPRPLPGRPPARNLHGISFAVSNMTGFVARACEGLTRPTVGVIRRMMADEARRLEKDAW